MPEWYPVVKAARDFGYSPWELLEHWEWIDLLYAAADGERRAAEYKAQRAKE